MKNRDTPSVQVQGDAEGIGGPSSGAQAAMSPVVNHDGGKALARAGGSRTAERKDPAPEYSQLSDKDKIKVLENKLGFFETILRFSYKALVEDSVVKLKQTGSKKKAEIKVNVRYIKTPCSKTGPDLEFLHRFDHATPRLNGTVPVTTSAKTPTQKVIRSNDNVGSSSLDVDESSDDRSFGTTARLKQTASTSGRNSSAIAPVKVAKETLPTSNDHLVAASDSHGVSSATARAQATKKKTPVSNGRNVSSTTSEVDSNINPPKASSSKAGKATKSTIPSKRLLKTVGEFRDATKHRRKAAAKVDHTYRKPSYSNPCNRETMKGFCDRTDCELLHDCQLEYLESEHFITDGYPWAQTYPFITALSDLAEHPNYKSFS